MLYLHQCHGSRGPRAPHGTGQEPDLAGRTAAPPPRGSPAHRCCHGAGSHPSSRCPLQRDLSVPAEALVSPLLPHVCPQSWPQLLPVSSYYTKGILQIKGTSIRHQCRTSPFPFHSILSILLSKAASAVGACPDAEGNRTTNPAADLRSASNVQPQPDCARSPLPGPINAPGAGGNAQRRSMADSSAVNFLSLCG